MTQEEKLRIAKQLEKLGVNVIEAGFAAASPGDFSAINAISKIIDKSTVCSLARALESDIRKSRTSSRSQLKTKESIPLLQQVRYIWKIN